MSTPALAVILCAGKGTRLLPRTATTPKVMLPVNGRPLLQHHFAWLQSHGITDFFVNLHYHADRITDYFGDGSAFGVRIRYSFEENLRGTAGALASFRDRLNAPFVLHYGDVYSELNIGRMFARHLETGALATLAVHPSSHPHDSDIVQIDQDGRVQRIFHKPGTADHGVLGNAGCCCLHPGVLDHIPDEPSSVDFTRDTVPALLEAGAPVFGYEIREFTFDMGTPERYSTLVARASASA